MALSLPLWSRVISGESESKEEIRGMWVLWGVWSRSGLFSENNHCNYRRGSDVAKTDNAMENCENFNLFKLNFQLKMCGVRVWQKRFSVLAQRKRFTLWKWVISEAIGGELYRGDSPVSTNTIQRINNSSAKSTTKSEPDKEPPQWPGWDAKSLWNCVHSEDLDKIPSDCKIQ